jgi:flagellin-like protein
MNIWGKKERSWRRKNKRGVSPIIATILLVAITVVLAAVLYILVQQYTKSGTGSVPQSITYVNSGGGKYTTNYYNDTFALSASTGLSTGSFGMKITTASGSVVALAGAPTNCGAGTTLGVGAACTAPASGTWYAVLYGSNNAVIATYSSAGWSATVTVTAADSLLLISYAPLSGSGDTLASYGTGTASVSGSVTL